MTEEIDRDQMIFALSLMSNYAESYLNRLSDEELIRLYEEKKLGQGRNIK